MVICYQICLHDPLPSQKGQQVVLLGIDTRLSMGLPFLLTSFSQHHSTGAYEMPDPEAWNSMIYSSQPRDLLPSGGGFAVAAYPSHLQVWGKFFGPAQKSEIFIN